MRFSKKNSTFITSNGVGNNKSFHCLIVDALPDFHFTGDSQCFPFYVYGGDGANRCENVTDWALGVFRAKYVGEGRKNEKRQISKRDIFHYVYAILHHPLYSEKYAANLKRELPRVPHAPDFWSFADVGEQLAKLHVNYESQTPYTLEQIENRNADFTLRVEKMRFSKDKTELRYNELLTLRGIPPRVYQYRLGNRSALK